MNKSEVVGNMQKKIKDYVISYDSNEFLGKNIHGEIRTGYRAKDNHIIVFRITPLPLTPQLAQFLDLQIVYSPLSSYSRKIEQPVQSTSNYYVPMEYFPKTFQSQKAVFKNNPKYMDQYIEKFLRVYAFFYNMRVAHGNLTARNIGITFEGKVKLMDFAFLSQTQEFESKSQRDFHDFKLIICKILEKDNNFPIKFSIFNNPETHKWQHLFSSWHITSPLQPLYLCRKQFIPNIVTLLYKLSQNLNEWDGVREVILSLRLLSLNYLKKWKDEQGERQSQNLQELVGKLQHYNTQYFNSIIMGIIKDPDYFNFNSAQRLILISALITNINHEYLYFDILSQLSNEQDKRNQLLGDSLLVTYKDQIYSNLLHNYTIN